MNCIINLTIICNKMKNNSITQPNDRPLKGLRGPGRYNRNYTPRSANAEQLPCKGELSVKVSYFDFTKRYCYCIHALRDENKFLFLNLSILLHCKSG